MDREGPFTFCLRRTTRTIASSPAARSGRVRCRRPSRRSKTGRSSCGICIGGLRVDGVGASARSHFPGPEYAPKGRPRGPARDYWYV